MSSLRTPHSSASSPTENYYTLWGLGVEKGIYQEMLVKAPSIRAARRFFGKHFVVGVGGCCRGDHRNKTPEPGMGSGFIDAVCPHCNQKVSWFGTLAAPPPCRHCGKLMEMIELTQLRMNYLEQRCKFYEQQHVNDPPEPPVRGM